MGGMPKWGAVDLLSGLDYLHSNCHAIHAGELRIFRSGPTTGIDHPSFRSEFAKYSREL